MFCKNQRQKFKKINLKINHQENNHKKNLAEKYQQKNL